MKFKIEVDDKLDLSTFRSMFFDLLGKDHNVYNIVIDNLIVRVTSYKDWKSQDNMVALGLLEVRNTTEIQFYPSQDVRFRNLSIVQELFPNFIDCKLLCREPDRVFIIIEKFIKHIYKANKLKAFA